MEHKIVEVTDENFESVIQENELLQITFTGLGWCMACKALHPTLEEISVESEIPICELDVDSNPIFTKKYNVRSIPTTFLIKNGEIVNKSVGVFSKEDFRKKMKDLV